jgi:hypothetical protein
MMNKPTIKAYRCRTDQAVERSLAINNARGVVHHYITTNAYEKMLAMRDRTVIESSRSSLFPKDTYARDFYAVSNDRASRVSRTVYIWSNEWPDGSRTFVVAYRTSSFGKLLTRTFKTRDAATTFAIACADTYAR